MKDSWDKLKAGATVFSLIAVPVVLAVGGWVIQQRIAEQSTRREYVQLALGILRDIPDEKNKDAQSLRDWAISIVDGYAPIKLTQESKDALRTESLALAPAPPGLSMDDSSVVYFENCTPYFMRTSDERALACLKRNRDKQEAMDRALKALDAQKGLSVK